MNYPFGSAAHHIATCSTLDEVEALFAILKGQVASGERAPLTTDALHAYETRRVELGAPKRKLNPRRRR